MPIWRFQKNVVPLQRIWETPRSAPLKLVLMFNRTIMYAKLAWVYAKEEQIFGIELYS